jgi:hypothetical protein
MMSSLHLLALMYIACEDYELARKHLNEAIKVSEPLQYSLNVSFPRADTGEDSLGQNQGLQSDILKINRLEVEEKLRQQMKEREEARRKEREERIREAEEKRAEGKNFYELLGVGMNATTADIRKAFLREIRQHHSDKGGSTNIAQKVLNAIVITIWIDLICCFLARGGERDAFGRE